MNTTGTAANIGYGALDPNLVMQLCAMKSKYDALDVRIEQANDSLKEALAVYAPVAFTDSRVPALSLKTSKPSKDGIHSSKTNRVESLIDDWKIVRNDIKLLAKLGIVLRGIGANVAADHLNLVIDSLFLLVDSWNHELSLYRMENSAGSETARKEIRALEESRRKGLLTTERLAEKAASEKIKEKVDEQKKLEAALKASEAQKQAAEATAKAVSAMLHGQRGNNAGKGGSHSGNSSGGNDKRSGKGDKKTDGSPKNNNNNNNKKTSKADTSGSGSAEDAQ